VEQSHGENRDPEPLRHAALRATLAPAALIVLAAIGAYHNSFSGPFIFDDAVIRSNPTILRLWPVWVPLFPPDDRGYATDRRPVTNLSLAFNYALCGTRVPCYHVFNLAVHILGGLTLFGIIRRSLRLPSVQLASVATPLALICVLIWIVHPLQTNAVTYIIQRTEVLAGLFYLLTLYCVLRGAEVDRSGAWYPAAVIACFLAMGSKESAFSAPVVVLLYDRLFLAGSWHEVRRRRYWLYVGLASAWLVPALYVGHALAVAAVQPARCVVNCPEVGWLDYALAQFESISLYLRLSFWPHPLILDYGPGGVKTFSQVAPYAAFVLVLVGGTLVSLWRWPALGFLGIWFFAILAPSSSIVPIHAECAAEKRMYLPLAAVILLTVAGVYCLGKHWRDRQKTPGYGQVLNLYLSYALAGATVIALMVVSVRRNEDYRSALTIWQDTVAKRPCNARAHFGLGTELANRERIVEAIEQYEKALEIKPEYAEAHNNLGVALAGHGEVNEATTHYRKALQIKPDFAEAITNLGNALADCGRVDEAIAHYRKALVVNPDFAEAHNNLGFALVGRGDVDGAIAQYRKALDAKPDYVQAITNLGNALAGRGKVDEAIVQYRKALEFEPDDVEVHANLGNALADRGQIDEAIGHYRKALEIKPDCVQAYTSLGNAFADRGEVDEAIVYYRQALQIKPDDVDTHNNLGLTLAGHGEVDEAIACFRRVLEIKPDYAEAHSNLGLALAGRGQVDEAIAHYRKALELAKKQNKPALTESVQAKLRLYGI